MFRTSRTETTTSDVEAAKLGAAATLTKERAAELKGRAGDVAAAATLAAATQYAASRERATDAASAAKIKAEEVAENLGPRVDQAKESIGEAKETFVEDVLPKILATAATVAAGAVTAKDQAVEAAERAPDAFAVLKGDAAVKRGGGKGKWFLLLSLIGIGAAVFAWRRSQERPDPWATATPYTPSTSSSNGSLGDTVREKATAAKTAAATAAAAATEKASSLKDSAGSSSPSTTPETDAEAAPDAGVDGSATWEPAGDFATGDAPSITGTSEGTDLSTPHLDEGTTGKP